MKITSIFFFILCVYTKVSNAQLKYIASSKLKTVEIDKTFYRKIKYENIKSESVEIFFKQSSNNICQDHEDNYCFVESYGTDFLIVTDMPQRNKLDGDPNLPCILPRNKVYVVFKNDSISQTRKFYLDFNNTLIEEDFFGVCISLNSYKILNIDLKLKKIFLENAKSKKTKIIDMCEIR